MVGTSQTDADLIPSETFRCLKVLEDVLANVDGILKQTLEDLSLIVNQLRPEEVILDRLAVNYRKIFTNHRKMYRNTSQVLRNVLNKMTNPSSLLEISLTAVSNYQLPTYELPKELELQFQEVEEKTSTLGDTLKYLKLEIRKWFYEVFFSISEFEIDFNRFLE